LYGPEIPDVNADSAEVVYDVEIDLERYRCTWLGNVDVPVARVRAFAFPEPGRLVLVRGDDGWQIPGGGVEDGEQASDAIRRELWEEAAASILVSHPIGAFQIQGLTHDSHNVHCFYACRVSLAAPWEPTHDISQRVIVGTHEFLDTLPWGRRDPRATFLLDRALEVEPLLW
jgi:8-oxo-dGTP pyrophosphatase MutT (NUDIX family)